MRNPLILYLRPIDGRKLEADIDGVVVEEDGVEADEDEVHVVVVWAVRHVLLYKKTVQLVHRSVLEGN